jgi:hypothetical protein
MNRSKNFPKRSLAHDRTKSIGPDPSPRPMERKIRNSRNHAYLGNRIKLKSRQAME